MKLSITGATIAGAISWGAVMFFTGLAYVIDGTYGNKFLAVFASVYPGYEVQKTIGSVIVATLYGGLDGAICGALFAWLYNTFS